MVGFIAHAPPLDGKRMSLNRVCHHLFKVRIENGYVLGLSNDQIDEINEWCHDTFGTGADYHDVYPWTSTTAQWAWDSLQYQWYFASEADGILFLLRWMGETQR